MLLFQIYMFFLQEEAPSSNYWDATLYFENKLLH